MIAGLIFINPLCTMLGATDTSLSYTRSYLSLILIGAPVITGSFVLNNQLRFQGNAVYAMIGIVSGAVLNIALDPLLMFVFEQSSMFGKKYNTKEAEKCKAILPHLTNLFKCMGKNNYGD